MGLGIRASLRSWQGGLASLARLVGVAHELEPVPDGQLAVRPFRLIVALWLLGGWYAVVKLYHGFGNLPANWPGLYVALLGLAYLVWRLGREKNIQRRILMCLDDAGVGERERGRGRDVQTLSLPLPLAPSPSLATLRWLAAGLALLLANLALLEWRHPYTFTQDDNLSQFLPVILHGCRGLFDDGIFPTWNAHQFGGMPTASLGIYALTYPPTYASYAVARWLLGNEYATLEVFGIAHLLAGYCTMVWAARTLGLRPALAAAAGLCFALCGFFLIGGRSWYYMLPLAAWLPLLAVSIWRLSSGRVGWRWMLGTGALLGIIFHAGNAQMWVYCVSFLGLAALYLIVYGGRPRHLLAPVAAAIGLGLGLALPLFVPQVLETQGLDRFAGGEPIVRGLFGLIAPWPLSFADRPGMVEGGNIRFMTQFYYAGTVFTIASAAGLFSCLVHRWPQRLAAGNVLLAMGLVAFLYALGRPAMVWGITGELPIFKQFRHPMKFLAFVHLFGILGGGMILERLLRRHWRPRWEWLLAGACAVLMSYHTLLARAAFFTWNIPPYPAAPDWLAKLADHPVSRIYPIAPRRSTAANYQLSQMVQLPSIYGTLSLTGYDPLMEENPQQREMRRRLESDPLAALRAYGVRYLVVYPPQDLPSRWAGHDHFRWYFWEPPERAAYQAVKQSHRLVHWTAGAAVYEIDGAAPLAFAKARPDKPLEVRFDAAGATVRLPKYARGESILVNVVPARFFRAYADGRRVPWQTDGWGRMSLAVPAGAKSVRIRYAPPWLAGSLAGLLMAIGSCAGYGGFRRYARSTDVVMEETD